MTGRWRAVRDFQVAWARTARGRLGGAVAVACGALVAWPALAQQDDGLSLSAAYRLQRDDNLFRLPDGANPRQVLGRDDASETVQVRSVGLRFDHDYGLQRIEAGLGLVDYRYDRYQQLDLLARNYDLRWRWALTPWLTGALSSERDESVNSFDDASVLTRGNRRVRRNQGATLRWQVDGPLSLLAEAVSTQNINQQPVVGDESNRIRAGGIGLRHDTRKGSSASLRYRSGSGETIDPDRPPALLRDDDFRQSEWLLDLRWAATANTAVELDLVRVSREHRTQAVRDWDATNLRLGLSHSPTARLLFRAGWSRDTGSYQTDNASIARTDRWTWLAQWAATAKLALIAQGSEAERQFLQPLPGQAADPQRDRTRDLSLTLRWSATRNTSVDLGWQHTRRLGSTPGTRFSSDAINAGVSARF